jgi:hypothetical protein
MISTHCCARTTAGHAALPLRTPKNSRRPISTLLSRRRHPNGSIQLHGRGQIRAALVVSRGDGQSPLWSKTVLTQFKWDVCVTPERHRSGPLFVVVQPAKWFNLGFNRGARFFAFGDVVNFAARSSNPSIAHFPHILSMSRGQRHWRVCLSQRRIYRQRSPKREPRRISRRIL